jgi:hypothetical protein
MNTSLLGVLAALALATGLWLGGRRPRPLLKSTDTREVAALNRAQNTLVWEARHTPPPPSPEESAPGKEGLAPAWSPRVPLVALPAARLSPAERRAWLQELRRHQQAGGAQRLEAMRRARAWGHRDVLPLLRQGLRDPDPRVVGEAALAMAAFRGRPAGGPVQAVAPPRNVARTR